MARGWDGRGAQLRQGRTPNSRNEVSMAAVAQQVQAIWVAGTLFQHRLQSGGECCCVLALWLQLLGATRAGEVDSTRGLSGDTD